MDAANFGEHHETADGMTYWERAPRNCGRHDLRSGGNNAEQQDKDVLP